MIAAIAFSGFVALSLAPMLCSVLLKPHSEAGGRGRLTQWVDDRFRSLETRYSGWLDGALRRPLIPLLLSEQIDALLEALRKRPSAGA